MIRILTFLIFLITKLVNGQNSSIILNDWSVINPFEQKNFIKNEGQCVIDTANLDYKIYFEAYTQGIHYYLCNKGIVIWKSHTSKKNETESTHDEELEPNGFALEKVFDTIQFVNSNSNFEVLLGEKVPNYYTYSSVSNTNDIKASAYKTITFKNIYSFIDLLFEFKPDTIGIKYSFILHPKANVEDIKLLFSEKSNITTTNTGNLVVANSVGTFVHHIPNTFSEDNKIGIESNYKLHNNVLQFQLAAHKTNETIIIDPWIVSPVNLTGNDGAFDVDYDNNGNVFIYGGTTQYTINKYDKTGTLLWTNTPFANEKYMYGDFAIDKNTGNAYIIQGLYFASKIKKLAPNGSTLASFSGIAKAAEMWRIAFDPCTNKGVIAGGGTGGPSYQTAFLDTTLAIVTPINYLDPINLSPSGDVGCLAIDNYGFCYQIIGYYNKIIKLSMSNLNNIIYQVSSGYNFAEYDSNYFHDPDSDYAPGYNGITISDKTLYTTDGYDVKKWNSSTGLLLKSKNIASSPDGNSSHKYWSGIASNNCNDILVSNNKTILLLDSGLNIVKTIAMPNTVYDILIHNKTVYVSGKSFLSTFSLNELTCPKVVATITQPDSCRGLGTATLSVTGGKVPYAINWSTTPAQNTNTVSGLSPGLTYFYNVEDNSCPKNNTLDSITVFNPSQIIVSIKVDSVSCQKINDGKISVSCTGGNLPYYYNWSNGQNGTNLNALEDLSSGNYSLSITDNKGCKNALFIEVPYSKNFKFSVFDKVNVFTPNNDGINDLFFPLTNFKNDFNSIVSIINEYDLTIYNRWGLKIYHTNNPLAFWDGKVSNTAEIFDGTFFWALKIKSNCINSKEETLKGFVQLYK